MRPYIKQKRVVEIRWFLTKYFCIFPRVVCLKVKNKIPLRIEIYKYSYNSLFNNTKDINLKKIILAIFIVLSPMVAQEDLENPFLGNDNFPMGYSLLADSMPNFMHLYMKGGGMHKLDLTQEQETAIEKVFATRPPKVMKAAQEIQNLETQLVLKVVNEGKKAEDVKELLDQIAQKRKEMTILKIGCLNIFKETLTKEQYKILRDMAIEEAENL